MDLLVIALIPVIMEVMKAGAYIAFVIGIIAKLVNMLIKAFTRGEIVV